MPMSFSPAIRPFRVLLGALASLGLACLLGLSAPLARAADTSAQPSGYDHVHDFDLFFGTWHSRQRRLKERLVGSKEWLDFEGTQVVRPLLDGQGNMTENRFTMPDGSIHRGVTVRAFDPKSQRWSIWWLDGNDPSRIDTPVVGTFEHGVGTFYSNDSFHGKPVKVRFTWSHITPTSLQWEQAYSIDGGTTWETNWVAYFSKTP